MTEPTTLPIQPPARLDTLRVPRRMYVLLIAGVALAAASTTASILNARATQQGNLSDRESVMENQRILQATCENTKAVTEQFASKSPAPCPTVVP